MTLQMKKHLPNAITYVRAFEQEGAQRGFRGGFTNPSFFARFSNRLNHEIYVLLHLKYHKKWSSRRENTQLLHFQIVLDK